MYFTQISYSNYNIRLNVLYYREYVLRVNRRDDKLCMESHEGEFQMSILEITGFGAEVRRATTVNKICLIRVRGVDCHYPECF